MTLAPSPDPPAAAGAPAHRAEDLVPDQGLVYQGIRSKAEVLVTVHHGDKVRLLPHHVRYAPEGFNWGDTGNGATDLARSLLLDALEEQAVCQTCQGGGRIIADPEDLDREFPYDPDRHSHWGPSRRCYCDSGTPVTLAIYMSFCSQVVQHLDEQWTLTQRQIRRWLIHNTAGWRHLDELPVAGAPSPPTDQEDGSITVEHQAPADNGDNPRRRRP